MRYNGNSNDYDSTNNSINDNGNSDDNTYSISIYLAEVMRLKLLITSCNSLNDGKS